MADIWKKKETTAEKKNLTDLSLIKFANIFFRLTGLA